MKIDLHYQNISFPFTFEISKNPEKDFTRVLLKCLGGVGKNTKIFLLCGNSGKTEVHAENYKKIIKKNFNNECDILIKKIHQGSFDDVCEVDYECAKNNISTMIALGGGKVIDVAKAVVAKRNLNLIIVPAVLSSDCISSPVSVLKDEQGLSKSIPSGIPSAIFIDLNITTNAPLQLTLSGVGDVFSNYSALLDFDLYENSVGGLSVNGFSKVLSRSSGDIVCSLKKTDLLSHDGHQKIATALMLSGFAMAFSGNSLPCSGAEHMISHAIDARGYGHGTHGIQVALGTIFCSELRKVMGFPYVDKSIIDAMNNLGIPNNPSLIGISENQYVECVINANATRPGRVTILSKNPSEENIRDAYRAAFFDIYE